VQDPGPVGVRYYQRNSGRRSMRAVEDARLLSLIEQTHAKTDPDRYTYVDLATAGS
jgi:hypothetical protein